MLRLLLTAGLLLPLTSCATHFVAVPEAPCRVPAWPAPPDLGTGPLTPAAIVALGVWARGALRFHEAVRGCPAVVEVP